MQARNFGREYTEDGNTPGVTTAVVDGLVNVSGFADAMIAVGWLSIENGGITMPHFDWHGAQGPPFALTPL
jgi:hypothetical protein